MKIVLSADRRDEGIAAREWCATHLDHDDSVIAVVGIRPTGEFVAGLPMFDAMSQIETILEDANRTYCIPLINVGIPCQTRLVHQNQAQALIETASREGAEMIVVGKHPHGAFSDALMGEIASHLVHHPPCPLLVVPVAPASATTSGKLTNG